MQIAFAGGWDVNNNPENIISASGGHMERNFSRLPTEGFLDKTPWPDTYWPRYKFGIADRFNETRNNPLFVIRTDYRGRSTKVYHDFTREDLLAMSPEQLNLLSPAEKLDVANGDYSYPTYHRELRAHSARAPKWEGYCHGWGPEALEQEEPGKCDYTNRDGITVPMTSSDIKGLFIFHRANINQNKATFCGIRSQSNRLDQDINAGAFRIILSNFFGIMKKGFVGDVDNGKEVWNQPIYGFKIVSQNFREGSTRYSAPGTVREVDEVINLYYINEIDDPSPEPQLGGPLNRVNDDPNDSSKGFVIRKVITMTTELDGMGNIIGGRYTGTGVKNHLDMVWVQDPAEFEGNFAILPAILEESLKNK